MQLQFPASNSRRSVERAVCAGVPGSLQKLSNTAARLAILNRGSWRGEPGTPALPTPRSQPRRPNPGNSRIVPAPLVTTSRCEGLCRFGSKCNWFLSFPFLPLPLPPLGNLIIQLVLEKTSACKLLVGSRPPARAPTENQSVSDTETEASAVTETPSPVHALTSGMTGQCYSTENFRVVHHRVIMFYITFPFKVPLLDIDVQLVLPPTLGVMERKREALPFSAL